ncbi:MAG: 50S ribosomal protein L11 methyltransferase [Desulfuromonadales bacterium]|nr:50S ribosomal protein L11 methyltransferase [Desulfuromonadales bacterium]MBN2793596.1 50S ribosomal protein L11 methyltransferase [Desulfuromonadales bacterium]
MKNEWFVIEVAVEGALVEVVSALLAEKGSQGTVIEERQLDTFVVPDDELIANAIYELKGYFTDEFSPEMLVAELTAAAAEIPILSSLNLDFRHGQPVQTENWKQNFSTIQIGQRLLIRPSWEERPLWQGLAVIEIDPGMAFGTGTHGTTRLCLEIIEEFLREPNPPATMLDVGTGSGILALGAAALGCEQVLATDIDEGACQVAHENIIKNSLQERITVTDQRLETLAGDYDLIVANILAEENVRLKREFFDRLAPGGRLVLSGILKEKEVFVKEHFADLKLSHLVTRYADEWVCMVFQRQE